MRQYPLTQETDLILQRPAQSLTEYIRFVHRYEPPPHQLEWIEALEDESIRELLIIAPPKYGKSPMVKDYLGWRIGRNRNHHFIYCSNTALQAYDHSVALRDTLALNERYRAVFRDIAPDMIKGWGEAEWFVKRDDVADKDPTCRATGLFGPILGATAEEIILDDLNDAENTRTPYQRDKAMDWIRQTVFSRLMPRGRKVCICTRWHEDDIAGHFMREGWKVIHLKALEDDETTYPTLWSTEELMKQRASMTPRDFELMFQGNTAAIEGSIFKHEWWRYWKELDPNPMMIVQVWDTAFKTKQHSDRSACETWYVYRNKYLLVDMWAGKVDFPDLKQAFYGNWEKWKPHVVLVEDAASGISLVQEMRTLTNIPVTAVKVDKDKKTRVNAVTPMVSSGLVEIPLEASWRHEWENEHESFPSATYDDLVDCTSMFLNWARTNVVEPHPLQEIHQRSKWRR